MWWTELAIEDKLLRRRPSAAMIHSWIKRNTPSIWYLHQNAINKLNYSALMFNISLEYLVVNANLTAKWTNDYTVGHVWIAYDQSPFNVSFNLDTVEAEEEGDSIITEDWSRLLPAALMYRSISSKWDSARTIPREATLELMNSQITNSLVKQSTKELI